MNSHSWLLLDQAPKISADGNSSRSSSSQFSGLHAPRGEQPPRERYTLGPANCFREAWWPELLRNWPSEGLLRVAHPEQRRCSFAARRLPGPGSEEEWAVLQAYWAKEGIPKATLLGAYRIQNRALAHGFAATRQALLARRCSEEYTDHSKSRPDALRARLLWHGTKSCDSLLAICNDGFDRAQASTCVYGKGCYFAASASYADKYGCRVHVPASEDSLDRKAILLATVLVGELCQGSSDMYPPPEKPHSLTGDRYENACDNPSRPSIFVTFKDFQAMPAYVMVYAKQST
mmetsp:Transcript_103232/g.298631  ORF Transcript_103232/g.298631 Transcript_103232/m.298631 type:complete len:290 (-) Transcript_103232:183-1052(-)